MIPHDRNQYGNNSYIESQLKRNQSDPPYIRMLTSPWEIASNAVEDINAMQELAISETSSGIDMKGGSTDSSTYTGHGTVRSEDTNISTIANISPDEDDPLRNPPSVIDDERPLSVHSISSVSVRKNIFTFSDNCFYLRHHP